MIWLRNTVRSNTTLNPALVYWHHRRLDHIEWYRNWFFLQRLRCNGKSIGALRSIPISQFHDINRPCLFSSIHHCIHCRKVNESRRACRIPPIHNVFVNEWRSWFGRYIRCRMFIFLSFRFRCHVKQNARSILPLNLIIIMTKPAYSIVLIPMYNCIISAIMVPACAHVSVYHTALEDE